MKGNEVVSYETDYSNAQVKRVGIQLSIIGFIVELAWPPIDLNFSSR